MHESTEMGYNSPEQIKGEKENTAMAYQYHYITPKKKQAPVAKASEAKAPEIQAPAPQSPEAKKAAPVFPYGGQVLPDGSVRFRVRWQILYDGDIDPSGVFWEKIVPPKASTADYVTAHAGQDEAIKRLTQKVTETKRPRRASWLAKKV